MASDIQAEAQSKEEIVGYMVDFVRRIPPEETIADVVVTHIPPDEVPATITAEIDGTAVTFEFGPVEDLGLHLLHVLVGFSNGQKAEVRLHVPVNW